MTPAKRRGAVGVTAVAALIGAVFVGHAWGLRDGDRMLTAGQALPEMLAAQYPGKIVAPWQERADEPPEVTFSRTMSKADYIQWLSKAVFAVQAEEHRRGFELANRSLAAFVDNMTKEAQEHPTPVSDEERNAAWERMSLLMAEAAATGYANALKTTSTAPVSGK